MTPRDLRAAYAALDDEIREIKFTPAMQSALLQSIMQYQYLEEQVSSLESLLAERRAQFRELQEFVLPELLRECGIWEDRWDLPPDWQSGNADENGNPVLEYIKVSDDFHCSIPTDRQYVCEQWLKANGAADKVSRKEVISIHAGSLKAVVRRGIEAADSAADVEEKKRIINLFKVYTYTKAEIKTSKPKKSSE